MKFGLKSTFFMLTVAFQSPVASGQPMPFPDELVEVETPGREMLFETSGELTEYDRRRDSWGVLFSVGLSQYYPDSYRSSYVLNSIEDSYGTPETSLVDISFGFSWNTPMGSPAIELGTGLYRNRYETSTDHTDIEIIPYRLQFTYALDTLMAQPYVAPYFFLGAYQMAYKEVFAASTGVETNMVDATTSINGYFGLGLLVQLNWMNSHASEESYIEFGLENAYLYLELRSFMSDGATTEVADLGSDLQFGAGLKLEY